MSFERVICQQSTIQEHDHGRPHEEIYRRLVILSGDGDEFTSDDLHDVISDLRGYNENVIGSVFREARKNGIIEHTGRVRNSRREEAKGRNIILWKSTTRKEANNHD